MTEDVIVWVNPRDIRAIGGFLGQRFEANRARRLKDPLLAEQFIRLHEERTWDEWFWMGEQVGKWLDASAYAALIAWIPILIFGPLAAVQLANLRT